MQQTWKRFCILVVKPNLVLEEVTIRKQSLGMLLELGRWAQERRGQQRSRCRSHGGLLPLLLLLHFAFHCEGTRGGQDWLHAADVSLETRTATYGRGRSTKPTGCRVLSPRAAPGAADPRLVFKALLSSVQKVPVSSADGELKEGSFPEDGRFQASTLTSPLTVAPTHPKLKTQGSAGVDTRSEENLF